jgi:hypothetical protein
LNRRHKQSLGKLTACSGAVLLMLAGCGGGHGSGAIKIGMDKSAEQQEVAAAQAHDPSVDVTDDICCVEGYATNSMTALLGSLNRATSGLVMHLTGISSRIGHLTSTTCGDGHLLFMSATAYRQWIKAQKNAAAPMFFLVGSHFALRSLGANP